MTQAPDGVVLAAVALFSLSSSSYLKVALDVLGTFLALVGSMLRLLLSRNLRGGLFRKPIQIFALSPLLIALREFLINSHGVKLTKPFSGFQGVVTRIPQRSH